MNMGAVEIKIRWEDLTEEKRAEILRLTEREPGDKPDNFPINVTIYKPLDKI